jgi:hypothetical protein
MKANMTDYPNPVAIPVPATSVAGMPGLAQRGFTALGLLLFNLFLILPAMLYAAMMCALYIVAIVVFVLGIALTSSSLAGVSEFVIDRPLRHIIVQENTAPAGAFEQASRLRIDMRTSGVHIRSEPSEHDEKDGSVIVSIGNPEAGKADFRASRDSRNTATLKGIGFIGSGILLVLLSMVLTRFTWIALKRYFSMNLSLLRAPAA